MKINVYCQNRGWLFEDLKRIIASYGAIPSEKPLPNFDRYICIRTEELSKSLKPGKTLVQVHDMKSHKLDKAGMVSYVHPSQKITNHRHFIHPIGSRDIPNHPLPTTPTIGFFCREIKNNQKGSDVFEKTVNLARQQIDFNVLMIGQSLKHITHLGTFEERAAEPSDYSRVTALFTASKTPMIPLSIFEAMSVGRSIISTNRDWIFDYEGIYEGSTVSELSKEIIKVVKMNKLWQSKTPYTRDDWARKQIEMVKQL